jgi:hypothetical protein
MRYVTALTLLVLAGGLVPPAAAQRLHRVESKQADHPVAVQVGDWVQLAFRYPINPPFIVNRLEVKVEGDAVKELKVLQTPILTPDGKPLLGSGEKSLFLEAAKPGTATVTVTPILGQGKPGDPVKVTIVVK